MSKKKKLKKSSKTHNYIAMVVTVSTAVVILAVVSIIIAVSKDHTTGTLNPKNTASATKIDVKDKSSALVESKALLASLESEGYTKEEINTSGQYVDGILFRMNEIGVFSTNLTGIPASNPDGSSPDDTAKYTELQQKIDRDRAVYLMVKLKKDFKSIGNVFDEYIVSIQLGIDLTMYLSDKEAYEKAKSDKMTDTENTDLITSDKIEKKMLENLQKQNETNRVGNLTPGSGSVQGNNSLSGLSQPDTNLPKVDVPRPADPAEELRKKIGQ